MGIAFTIELHSERLKNLLKLSTNLNPFSQLGGERDLELEAKFRNQCDLKRIVARKTLGVYNTPEIEVTKIIVTKI